MSINLYSTLKHSADLPSNLKERLKLTKYYNFNHYSHRAYEIQHNPYRYIWLLELEFGCWYFRLGEKYVNIETFLLSNDVPLKIKKIIMFNLDEVIRK